MLYFIIGLIVGAGMVYLILRPRLNQKNSTEKAVVINEDEVKKRENIVKIENYIKDKDQFTNDDLQNLLKVSDTTIGRYLEELEHDEVIKQVGKTGRSVYYEKS